MKKQWILVGIVAVSLGAATEGRAQSAASGTPAQTTPAQTTKEAPAQAKTASGRVPNQQPPQAAAPTVPTGEVALGSVRLPKGLTADGKPLPAGTYQVKLTGEEANPAAVGITKTLERWVEFTQGGTVKGREVASIVPQAEIKMVVKDAPPPSGGSKVQTLKGNDYVRVWINRGGNHYLLHLPVSATTP